MRRSTAFATALALTAGLSLPAHAEPGEALDRLLDGWTAARWSRWCCARCRASTSTP